MKILEPATSAVRQPRAAAPRLRDWLAGLSYSSTSSRDLRFDFLRGFAVFAMVIDHLAGPSRLYLLTGGNYFYTSAAEGFVFLAGLVVGIVYRRIAERDGLAVALRRLLTRAWQLYVLAIGLTLALLPLSEMLGLPWALGIDRTDSLGLVWSIVNLHQTYYLVDVPLVYALLIAAAPVGLILLHDGRAWIVLLVSWLVWAGYQLYPALTEVPWTIQGNYLFFFPAWQVLFFTALVMGYHRERISRGVPVHFRTPLLAITGVAFAGLILMYVNSERVLMTLQELRPGGIVGGYSLTTELVDVLFAKATVGPGRLVASAIVFLFLHLVTTALWKLFRTGLGWLLLPFGQNALYAYSAHVVAAVVVGMASAYGGLDVRTRPDLSLAIQVSSLAALWLAIRYRVLLPDARTRSAWMASVVPLALVVLIGARLDQRPDLPGLDSGPTPIASDADLARARAFGTPIPRDVERARRFGTPVPRPPAAPAGATPSGTPSPDTNAVAPAEPTPEPLPPPDRELTARWRSFEAASLGLPRVSPYVGDTEGTFREAWFYSPALDREMPYYLYLPPGYGSAVRRYPVLFMLHGGSQDRDEWPAYGLVDAIDRLIANREIGPMMLVLPQGDYGYWVNHASGGQRWGDYIAEDLVRHMDATYRTLPDDSHRAVGGLSMGGFGALQLAFNYPGVFSGVGAHSPALYPEDGSLPILGFGPDFASRDPVLLAATARGLDRLAILLDIGEGDPFVERAVALHEALLEREIDHRWLLQAGGHDFEYWERHLLLYLRFYDEVLNWQSG
jgi:enterochelin esterase-like enzyme